MKRLAVLFAVAVITPSLVLAGLAFRSLRDQQFILERQQALLCQGIADSLAREVAGVIDEMQRAFAAQVDALLLTNSPSALAAQFDDQLRPAWNVARVGFAVSLEGVVHSPAMTRPETRQFRLENDQFLRNRSSAEVYSANAKGNSYNAYNNAPPPSQGNQLDLFNTQQLRLRQVTPQPPESSGQQALNIANQHLSKFSSTEAEFRQLVGDSSEGTVARFLQNQLNLLFWYRPARAGDLIFGAWLDLDQLRERLRNIPRVDPNLQEELAVALLDDTARPVAVSPSGFTAPWKQPFAATEVDESLPHWELAVYLRQPEKLSLAAQTARLTLALLIGVLLVAITVGSWLIVGDVRRQLALARQKTDFVSNVSHELKTPLTSIRMFAELLAEERAAPDKRRHYLGIITAEAARLTRLINNVLDFTRFDRGEKQLELQPCDLGIVVGETLSSYRAHLEASGFTIAYTPPTESIPVRADRDALAQVLVNLLANAEKYSNGSRNITVETLPGPATAEVSVLDRGPGVPRGCEQKIFVQFFRAHDSLASGIQGSGLGLTLARQIARAHGGDLTYSPRPGGGSCFTLQLPRAENSQTCPA